MIWQTIGPVWIDCLTVNVPTVWAKKEWVWMFGVFLRPKDSDTSTFDGQKG